jgi:hypothetical protein
MTTTALRSWTDLVKLHPDVESGALTEAVFAIDLDAIAAKDSNVPAVNRDPKKGMGGLSTARHPLTLSLSREGRGNPSLTGSGNALSWDWRPHGRRYTIPLPST